MKLLSNTNELSIKTSGLVEVRSTNFHKDLTYLVLSDIHLGHRNTTTKEIVSHLDAYFGHYNPTHTFATLDIIFIAGDLFDAALLYTQDEISLIQGWMCRLMDFCSRHGIKLRILEGTPSHDNFQCRNLVFIAQQFSNKLDFKYIETLHIEKMTDIPLSILYVPDEWSAKTSTTQEQVEALLKEESLAQVDIAIMHGMFTYQVPELANNALKHDETFYLSKVKYFINIGHVHLFSTFDRILSQGSVDRLCHGEEAPKGGIMCFLRKDGNNAYTFVENKFAKIYKTIHVRYNDLDKAISQVTAVLDKIPPESYVRIKAKKDHPIFQGLSTFKKSYPFITFSKLSEEDEETDKRIQDIVDKDEEYTPINLNRENIVTLLMAEVKSRYKLDDNQFALLEKHLNSFK